ncbi:MAG: response regulator [Campylobacterota bacterium]
MRANITFLKSLTLLYAEDNKNTRETNSKTFGFFFKRVLSAQDGEEALKLYKNHHPHIVILDILMPQINGIEVAQRIREIDADVPIIILSGHDEKEMLHKAIKIGVLDFMSKPLLYENFKQTLEVCADRLSSSMPLQMQLDTNLFYIPGNKRFKLKDKEILLTKKEQVMFEILYENIGNTIETDVIESYMIHATGSQTNVKNLAYKLRKKLQTEKVVNRKGIGYALEKYDA